jgi:hypothetical protein
LVRDYKQNGAAKIDGGFNYWQYWCYSLAI